MNALPPDPPAIIGRASVIDGDTLEIHGQRIRLWGVDAPESRQTCTRGGATYRCGTEAANALDARIASRPVSCVPYGRPDRYLRVVAICRVGGQDLAAWMVDRGHALDFPRYSRGAFARQQGRAQDYRRGVWAGEFQRPWEWRAER